MSTVGGEQGDDGAFDVEQFIYVRIPGDIQPTRRFELEDLIQPALEQADVGEVSGGGSQLGDVGPDGRRPIEFCGIDIDTTDCDAALRLLRSFLPQLAIPVGTQLEYTRGDARLADLLTDEGWLLECPRTDLHPGFDI